MEDNKMATKKIFPLLLSMAFPPMISMLIQSLYNIVDSIFVAQISQNALTAVSLAFPIQNLIVALAVGVGVGTNSYIARKIGEKNQREANRAAAHGYILAGICSLLFTVIMLLCSRSFFRLFSDDPFILQDALTYTKIVVLFCFTSFFHICAEKIFQATGKMIFPMALQALGAIINIILDPIFIFGYFGVPAMGVAGAAIATVIGQFVAMSASLIVFFTIFHDIQLSKESFHFSLVTMKKILTIAIPNACMNALGSILTIGLNAILITFSNTAVSLFGIYFKLQTFVFMPSSGVTQGAMPIMGFNYGAKQKQRLLETLHYALMVTGSIMVFGCLLFFFFPKQLLMMFHADEAMLTIGIPALKILSFSFLPATFGFILPTLFQAMGKGFYSLCVFLLRQFLITLPLAYVASKTFGLTGIWIVFIIAESVAAIVAFFFYCKLKKSDPVLAS